MAVVAPSWDYPMVHGKVVLAKDKELVLRWQLRDGGTRAELAEARKAMREGRGHEAEMQRLHEEKLEAEKEKRVAHLQQLGVRRLCQQGLARGWTAWVDVYESQQRKKRLHMTAGARMAKPKMVPAFTHWLHDWEANAKKSVAMSVARAGRELQAARQAKAEAEAQLEAVQSELVAAQQVPRAAQSAFSVLRQSSQPGMQRQ